MPANSTISCLLHPSSATAHRAPGDLTENLIKETSHVLSVDFWRPLTFHPMPNTAPMPQEIETESELEEERVPTPEVMKKEDEDLDTDQVKPPCPLSNLNKETNKKRKKKG